MTEKYKGMTMEELKEATKRAAENYKPLGERMQEQVFVSIPSESETKYPEYHGSGVEHKVTEDDRDFLKAFGLTDEEIEEELRKDSLI